MVTHRYLGVVVGALMLVWCLSGFVMLFAHWPEVTEAERTAGLAPIDATQVRLAGLMPNDARVTAAAIEMAGGAPVLKVTRVAGAPQVLDLATGKPLAVDAARARAIAAAYGGPATRQDLVVRDQWTVSGAFDRARPFWRERLADGTDLYVSARTGALAQRTTAAGRIGAWLGAIPHWLYPTLLRKDARLWAQVVIWTSLAGTFLTASGLYLGVTAWRADRISPYRGLMRWHHVASLAAGVLTLTWVASGLVSVNPWGLLESGDDPAAERLAGPPPAWGEARAALQAAAVAAPGARRLRLAPFGGRLFVMADDRRLDAGGAPARLSPQGLAAAARSLGAIESQGRIATGDAYYFAHHEAVRLPAWRIVLADGRREYLDPASGEVLRSVDAAARGFRWLHLGLHRLDFTPGLDRGPAWAAVMVLLLGGVTLGVGAGVWLAWRRLLHDLGRLSARRASARTAV